MRRRSPAGQALTDLILETFRLHGRLLATGDRLTRAVGQTAARWQVLGSIQDEPQTVAQVARAMGLARQSVQRTVDRLQADGIVTYKDNPAHLRSKLVTLTPKGSFVLTWISGRQIRWANDVALRLGEQDLHRACRVIRAFREELEHADRAAARKGRVRSTLR